MLDIAKNRQDVLDLLKTINREGMSDLLAWLENSDFFTSPASSRYHSNVEGGLAFHSLKVYELLVKKVEQFGYKDLYSQETLILCGLMHDLCKANTYFKDTKNKKINGKWEQVYFWNVQDRLPLGHAEKSLAILLTFIHLSKEEMLAIRWHMGIFDPSLNSFTGSQSFHSTVEHLPLAVILATSDFEATYLLEEIKPEDERIR